MEVNMNSNLKSYRIAHCIKQIDVADKLKVSKQTINKWEMGRALVPYAHWFDLSTCLNVTLKGLEAILIQTLLDGCVESGSNRLLLNAKRSRVYDSEMIEDALGVFAMRSGRTAQAKSDMVSNEYERKIFELEKALLERDKRIFELEKELERRKGE
jgi:DNA-binding XRE family transcriptional regulator